MGASDKKPRRQSIRLRGYDYTRCGAYFVTICADQRRPLFGYIANAEMQLSALGQIAAETWRAMRIHFPNVELDEYIVMPNHMHGIIILTVAAQHAAPSLPPPRPFAVRPGSLGAIVRSFKSAVSKRANELHLKAGALWQRNYYEHVIRDDVSLARIREYIVTNPLRWELDRKNPERRGEDEFDRWSARFGGTLTSQRR